MQELIKIQKTEIGAEIINSVNARELHKQLEVKKDYSTWIKAQINRAGLEENRDFIKLPQKGEQLASGAKWITEYIITTEGAKHIAMISNTPRGKTVRDYFIDCEKKYQNMLDSKLSSQSKKIEELKKQNKQIHAGLPQSNNECFKDNSDEIYLPQHLGILDHIFAKAKLICNVTNSNLNDVRKTLEMNLLMHFGVSHITKLKRVWLKDIYEAIETLKILQNNPKESSLLIGGVR